MLWLILSLRGGGGCPEGVRDVYQAGRVPQKTRTRQTGQESLTAPAGARKLAGYLKNPYSENLADVPDGPEASESVKTRR